MRLAVCWKLVALGGPGDSPDSRWAGVSPADEAALELALRLRELAGPTSSVEVVTLGSPTADGVLRTALAAGADRAVRVDGRADLDSSTVAGALAVALTDADQVWCGDYSLDRGTGSVPAFLADRLGAQQALGLVGVDVAAFGSGAPLRVVRRLDGGRREVLDVGTPAVLSVEGSVANLRRAGLNATLAARTAAIDVVAGPSTGVEPPEGVVTPYRPRARVLPPPVGTTLGRVRDILDVRAGEPEHAETVTLDPPDAAARLLEQLRHWGYLDGDPADN